MVLFLFLVHLGLGIVFALVFVSRETGVKFFRFNSGLAAVLIGVAFALRPPAHVTDSAIARIGYVALGISEAAIVVYWTTVGRRLAAIRPVLVAAAAGAGLVAIVAQALMASASVAPTTLPAQVMTIASFLSSSALLGGTCTAMVLGHWYLVIPSMPVSHLRSIVRLHIASLLVRIVVVAAAGILANATWHVGQTWQTGPAMGPSFRYYITSLNGIFFWQRVLFGLAGPALLSFLTWETAKIRSTQSATGILYVDFFTVVVGEVLAKYILLSTHVPV